MDRAQRILRINLPRGEVAIEVKGSGQIHTPDLHPLKAFIQDYRPQKAFLVCNERRQRLHDKITIIPWSDFLSKLWDGEILA
jgi:hypothetical protein